MLLISRKKKNNRFFSETSYLCAPNKTFGFLNDYFLILKFDKIEFWGEVLSDE